MNENKKPINKQFKLHRGLDDELIGFIEEHGLTGRHFKEILLFFMSLSRKAETMNMIDLALMINIEGRGQVFLPPQQQAAKVRKSDFGENVEDAGSEIDLENITEDTLDFSEWDKQF